jgi:hypothetical protein
MVSPAYQRSGVSRPMIACVLPGAAAHLAATLSECASASPPDIRRPAYVGPVQTAPAAGHGLYLAGLPAIYPSTWTEYSGLAGQPGPCDACCATVSCSSTFMSRITRSAMWPMSAGPLRSHADTGTTSRSRTSGARSAQGPLRAPAKATAAAQPPKGEIMHRFILQQLTAEHVKDQLAAAADDARRARQARRARRSRAPSGAPETTSEVIMTIGPRTIPAHWTACWRAACHVAAGLRDLHHEQVHAWECICRASRAPVDRPGPLTWIPSLDGPRLVGTRLPAPDAAASPDH